MSIPITHTLVGGVNVFLVSPKLMSRWIEVVNTRKVNRCVGEEKAIHSELRIKTVQRLLKPVFWMKFFLVFEYQIELRGRDVNWYR